MLPERIFGVVIGGAFESIGFTFQLWGASFWCESDAVCVSMSVGFCGECWFDWNFWTVQSLCSLWLRINEMFCWWLQESGEFCNEFLSSEPSWTNFNGSHASSHKWNVFWSVIKDGQLFQPTFLLTTFPDMKSSQPFVVGYFGRRMTTTFIDAHRKATTHKSPHKASDILLVAENVYVRESSPSGEPIATETDFIRACEK